MPFDIDKAVTYLDAHAHATTQHMCATYVYNAISSPAGGGLPMNTKLYAKEWGPLFEDAGFKPVTDGTIQKGDVAVIQGVTATDAGHVEMFDGTDWVSDFNDGQGREVYPGPGYKAAQPSYTIYRYKSGQQSSAGVRGTTVAGTKLLKGAHHGVAVGSKKRHLSHQLASLEGGGQVTQGSGTVFVGRDLHPVARVGDGTTDGPIEVGENTVLIG